MISKLYEKAPNYMIYKEGWGSTELGGASTGAAAAYGGIKMGSCNQLAPNLRLQVNEIYLNIVRYLLNSKISN